MHCTKVNMEISLKSFSHMYTDLTQLQTGDASTTLAAQKVKFHILSKQDKVGPMSQHKGMLFHRP